MCGIAGIFNISSGRPVDGELKKTLERMSWEIRHRGPDGKGIYHESFVGLAHRRLSIIDSAGGAQPFLSSDNNLAIVFNGEIFNYIELRDELIKKGHRFRSQSDTEVIIHAYEEFGSDFPKHFNGQFSIALYDKRNEKLLLVRDRVGIHPLFYTFTRQGDLIFASEKKALFCHEEVKAEFDYSGIEQTFNTWSCIPPTTTFKNIHELPPANIFVMDRDGHETFPYWQLDYPLESASDHHPFSYYRDTLEEILIDSIRLRLRSDVSVGAYMSGGLDSSLVAAIHCKYFSNSIKTYSVSFKDKNYDETLYQQIMQKSLGLDHETIIIDNGDISDSLGEVVRLAEKPLLRSAPAPMLKLSELVSRRGCKVVLTGEGSDEFLGGYNIFKENKIRRYWSSNPGSKIRPKLLEHLYPYVAKDEMTARSWRFYFSKGLSEIDDDFYSHRLRWNNTSFITDFFIKDVQNTLNRKKNVFDPVSKMIPENFRNWHFQNRAQFLEAILFMPGSLLCSQGDRMLMGNSVEGRFPFLDHRLIEFANKIPPRYKLHGLNEKFILKQIAMKYLPKEIVNRDKRPYRAPIQKPVTQKNELINELVGDNKLMQYGHFDRDKVRKLMDRSSNGANLSERENMALMGIVSMQLLHYHFIS